MIGVRRSWGSALVVVPLSTPPETVALVPEATQLSRLASVFHSVLFQALVAVVQALSPVMVTPRPGTRVAPAGSTVTIWAKA